jgi:uncharacterized FAD-dependent dehydrogenase
MNKIYSTLLVGSGPSCIFAAIELVKNGYKNILILEAGKKYEYNDPNRSLTQLFFGAAGNSDGKLTLHHQVGTTELPNLVGLPQYYELMEKVEQVYIDFKPTKEQREIITGKKNDSEVLLDRYNPSEEALKFRAKALSANLDMLTYSITHLGSDNGYFIGDNIYNFLIKNGASILSEHKVTEITKKNDLFQVFVGDKLFEAKNVIIGVGRSGASDFAKFMAQLGVPIENGSADCGLRIEVSNEICSKLIDAGIYEPKIISRSNKYDDRVRSFCWNYAGEVVAEKYPHNNLVVANGHSLSNSKTKNTNFALLVTKKIPHPLQYLESVCNQINILAENKIMVQRLGDLLKGRRSTVKRISEGGTIPTCDAYPGDLGLAMPHRVLSSILEMLESMNKILPGIYSDYTLIYGAEAKFYVNSLQLDKYAQTCIPGLYATGDCTSKSRGQVASSVMGLMAAKGILNDNAKTN